MASAAPPHATEIESFERDSALDSTEEGNLRLPVKMVTDSEYPRGRTAAIVTVNLLIALDHFFRLGSLLRGPLSTLYYSYFYDVGIPFGMYLLLCLDNVGIRFRYLRDWRVKAILVFGVGSFTEILQGFGVPILGRTFDPLDFVMFAGGILLAALADRFVLDRFFPRRFPKTVAPADTTDAGNL